jgi:hypothetical protein
MENIDEYLAHIAGNYASMHPELEDFNEKFRKELCYEVGRKYIKIISGGSVHSFIVLEDGPKFKRGDILKAASWRTPALNFKRGNVLTKEWKNVRWTGA